MPQSDAILEYWSSRDGEAFDRRTRESGRMAAIERMAEIARPFLGQPGAVTVDLGCGTGLFAVAVGTPGLIGVDASASLLKLARARMDAVRQADLFDMPIERGTADNVVSSFVADDYPPKRKQRLFEIVFAMLRPAGRFFLAAYAPEDESMRTWNDSGDAPFVVHLEDATGYDTHLRRVGFTVRRRETVRTGKREFLLRVARR